MHHPALTPLMSARPVYGIVFWAVYVLWFAIEMVRDRTKRPVAGANRKDRGSGAVLMVLLIAGIFAAFDVAYVYPQATIIAGRVPIFWSGVALMIAGILFRGWAVRTLGRFFTFEVAIRQDHTVITAGPYSYIRHPSYTGAMMTLVGIGMALTNWVSLALITVFGLAGYVYRMGIEERALREALGQAYVEYMQRTRRLIPFVY